MYVYGYACMHACMHVGMCVCMHVGMLCYVMLWYAISCYVMAWYFMLCDVMSCYDMLCYAILCDVVLCMYVTYINKLTFLSSSLASLVSASIGIASIGISPERGEALGCLDPGCFVLRILARVVRMYGHF